MPRNARFPGKKIDGIQDEYYESKVEFQQIYNNPIINNNLIKPSQQTSLDETKVNKMIDEYNATPYFLKSKNKVVIGYFANKYYIIDGQHRIETAKQLYERHNKQDFLIFCWYTIKSSEQLNQLFLSHNHDSYRNKLLLSEEDKIQTKINNFIELLKQNAIHNNNNNNNNNNKSIFVKTKTPNGRIKTLEEFRDQLITIKYFTNDNTAQELYDMLTEANNAFYNKYQYDVFLSKETNISTSTTFYKEDYKKIKTKNIISCRHTNFIEYLQDNTLEPFHAHKKEKKPIKRFDRNKCWEQTYPNTQEITCPIPNCSERLCKTDFKTWHAGHIISEHNGGQPTPDNLRPICPQCNSSMGSSNWEEYISPHTHNKQQTTNKN